MNNDNFNTITSNPNTKRLLPKIELLKILHEYSTVKQRSLRTIESKTNKEALASLSQTCRLNQSIANNDHDIGLDLDHIDKDLFSNEEKLITNIQVKEADPIIDISVYPIHSNKPQSDCTQSINTKRDITLKPKTKPISKISSKGRETTRAKSVNVSPLRLNEKINGIKDISHKKPNVKMMRNMAKFINKPPKHQDKMTNDTSTSRSTSVTIYRKHKSSAVLHSTNKSKSKTMLDNSLSLSNNANATVNANVASKRHMISFPSITARNNDKIIIDLQTMFGKKLEHLDGMYPSLSEVDKKNLISVLLSIAFELKVNVREERNKNEQLTKELQMKTKQFNILCKEMEGIKKHHSHSRSQVKTQTFTGAGNCNGNTNMNIAKLKKTNGSSDNNNRSMSQPPLNQVNQVKRFELNKVLKPKLK